MLPLAQVIHTLGHQRDDGIHAIGNSTADMVAKAAVLTGPKLKVTEITMSQMSLDKDILKAVEATKNKENPPVGVPKKDSYFLK